MKKLITVLSVMLLVVALSTTIVQAKASGTGKIKYNAWLSPIRDNCKTSITTDPDGDAFCKYYLGAQIYGDNIIVAANTSNGYRYVLYETHIVKAYGHGTKGFGIYVGERGDGSHYAVGAGFDS